MKNQIKVLMAVAFAFGIGFGTANIAMSTAPAPSIAVVNIDKLLNSSAQVSALKKNNKQKLLNLNHG